MAGRVLIVDDARYMRTILREIFTDAGWDVVADAADGEEAAALYREYEPDLVVLDLVMPRVGGLETMRRILRRNDRARILVCSALGEKKLVEEVLNAGAAGYIVKPFYENQLLRAARQALEQKK